MMVESFFSGYTQGLDNYEQDHAVKPNSNQTRICECPFDGKKLFHATGGKIYMHANGQPFFAATMPTRTAQGWALLRVIKHQMESSWHGVPGGDVVMLSSFLAEHGQPAGHIDLTSMQKNWKYDWKNPLYDIRAHETTGIRAQSQHRGLAQAKKQYVLAECESWECPGCGTQVVKGTCWCGRCSIFWGYYYDNKFVIPSGDRLVKEWLEIHKNRSLGQSKPKLSSLVGTTNPESVMQMPTEAKEITRFSSIVPQKRWDRMTPSAQRYMAAKIGGVLHMDIYEEMEDRLIKYYTEMMGNNLFGNISGKLIPAYRALHEQNVK